MAVAAGLLVACGDGSTTAATGPSTTVAGRTSTASPTTVAGRTYTGDLATVDGSYTVTVLVGAGTAVGNPECPATAVPGKTFLPVTLTVVNKAADKAVPFPPLRVEMTAAPGAKPAQVLLRDVTGACTFTPKVTSIAPGASVAFKGTSPAIDATATPGAAGRIEVSVSENKFSLGAPVP